MDLEALVCAAVSDVLFRYQLMARDRDRSWFHRAFLNEERQLAAGLVKLVETAALEVSVQKQFEKVSIIPSVLIPASQVERTKFYDEPEPHPPSEGQLVNRVDRFPLKASIKIVPCPRCGGRGCRICDDCRGQKKVRCSRCKGSGRELLWLLKCAGCGGDGVVTCGTCDQNGEMIDPGCAGEGKVASWDIHVFEYWVQEVSETWLPPNLPEAISTKVVAAVHHKALKAPSFSLGAVTEMLGYTTPEVETLMDRAEGWVSAHRRMTIFGGARCIHVAPTVRVMRLSSCRVLSESQQNAGDYWLIGQGSTAREVPPTPTYDPWKVGALPGLAVASLAMRVLPELAGIESLALVLVFLGGVFAFAGVGFSLAGVGARRVLFARRERVRTIAVLPSSGARSVYLSCLGTVGSLASKLEVLDYNYRGDMEAMMGSGRPSLSSQSLAVRTSDGVLVRLIEVARPAELTDDELARMARAVEGVVYLSEEGHSAEALRARLRRVFKRPLPEATIRVDGNATETDRRGVTAEGDLGIEAVRKAFTRESEAKLDWLTVFARLWAPVETALEGKVANRDLPSQRTVVPTDAV